MCTVRFAERHGRTVHKARELVTTKALRVDTVVETKLSFKVVRTTGLCVVQCTVSFLLC